MLLQKISNHTRRIWRKNIAIHFWRKWHQLYNTADTCILTISAPLPRLYLEVNKFKRNILTVLLFFNSFIRSSLNFFVYINLYFCQVQNHPFGQPTISFLSNMEKKVLPLRKFYFFALLIGNMELIKRKSADKKQIECCLLSEWPGKIPCSLFPVFSSSSSLLCLLLDPFSVIRS